MAVQRLVLSLAAVASLLSPAAAQAPRPSADWPQWRGPNRDGAVTSWVEPKAWPAALSARWKVPVGLGYATPIVVGDRVFVFTRQDAEEVLQAIDGATGKPIWQARYPAPFKMSSAADRHGEGPKATPTFSGGRIYTLGMGGVVSAFDAATGKQLWQTAPSANPAPLYGTAMSPLVDRGLVIVHVGGHNKGALTAFDPETGTVKWHWDGDGPAYNAPIAADLGGTRQVVTFTQDNLVGVSAATGELLWQRPFKTRAIQNTITPILFGDTLIVSGLDMPVTAFRVVKGASGWTTEEVWSNPDLPLYMTNGVVADDTLFGMTHKNSGQFFALDAKTGKTLWTSAPRQATNAAMLRVGNQIFALKDDAELLVLSASRVAFEPVHRYTVADSPTWAQPTISRNRIYVKDLNTLALFTVE
ncbi:MAG: PQQ-binding-like beta-propeller repeat protein [Vicinamibacterales bacterium]